jgi:hypothetical protein
LVIGLIWHYVKHLFSIFVCLVSFDAFAVHKEVKVLNAYPNQLLLEDNTSVELADIIIPNIKKNKTYLKTYLNNKNIVITHEYPTRYGSKAVYGLCEKETQTIQEHLLQKGYAYRYIMHPIENSLEEKLAQSEKYAQQQGKGIWALSPFKVINTTSLENTSNYKEKFVFVKGIIQDISYSKGKYYFYFDANHDTDFTVMIRQTHASGLTKELAKAWVGKSVEVRGWLEYFNGPYMQLYHISHFNFL